MVFAKIKPSYSKRCTVFEKDAYENIYNEIFNIVYEDNHEKAEDVASWCEISTVGEIYDDELFSVEIIDG